MRPSEFLDLCAANLGIDRKAAQWAYRCAFEAGLIADAAIRKGRHVPPLQKRDMAALLCFFGLSKLGGAPAVAIYLKGKPTMIDDAERSIDQREDVVVGFSVGAIKVEGRVRTDFLARA